MVQRTCPDPQQDVSRSQLRLGRFRILQHLRPAMLLKNNRFHALSFGKNQRRHRSSCSNPCLPGVTLTEKVTRRRLTSWTSLKKLSACGAQVSAAPSPRLSTRTDPSQVSKARACLSAKTVPSPGAASKPTSGPPRAK